MSKIRHTSVAPTDTRRLTAGHQIDPHWHDDPQLIYASAGVLEVVVDEGTWFTPSTRAVWVPAGVEHRWQVHGKTTVHLVGVPGARRGRTERPSLVLVTPLVRELLVACAENGPARTASARRMLHVLRDQVTFAPQAATVVPVLHDDRLRGIEEILQNDPTASLTLAQLGRRVGAGERTLSRLFHEEVGMSFTTWRTQQRLHRATLLLAEGVGVTRAAAESGFSSPSAFIVAFQAAFGRTPGSLYR